jgi:hypothetical protein
MSHVNSSQFIFTGNGSQRCPLLLCRYRLATVSHLTHAASVLTFSTDSESKSNLCYDRRSVGHSLLVSSRIWGPRQDFCDCQTVAGLSMWGAVADERRNLSFTIAAGPLQRNETRARVPRDSWPHVTVSESNQEGQFPVFISTRNRITQLHPPALDFLFAVSYDSQGYGVGIRTYIHTGYWLHWLTERQSQS